MTSKPVVFSTLARADVDSATDYYLSEAGAAVALRFVESLERSIRAIGRHPAAGSPRYAQELDLPGLRSRSVGRYPYLVFYVEADASVRVWRVLHAQRDIPGWLQA